MTFLKRIVLPDKFFLWAYVFIIGIIIFALFRLLFLTTHRDLIDNATFGNVLTSFWIGFRFDALVLAVIILPLFIISLIPFIKISNRISQRILAVFLTIIFSLMILLSAADLKFFDNFGSRLNFWAVEYIEFPRLFLYTVMTTGSFWILSALWIGVTIIFYYVIRKIIGRLGRRFLKSGKMTSLVIYILSIMFLALAIRGRLGMKALDWGEAFFCDNQFINQMSLNSVYTLSHSIYEEYKAGRNIRGETDNRFNFYDIDTAYKNVTEMLHLRDEIIEPPSLLRRTDGTGGFGFPPNIVIVIMESWSADKIGALGGKYNISPEFDSLCADGILFSNFYANGIRTNRGIPAVLCSFPSLPGRSIMKRYSADYPFRSIADILDEYDYTSIFAYGGDIQFDNMKGFLTSVGYDKFYDENDFVSDEKPTRWGVADHILFETLADEIRSIPRPFQLSILTLSFHDPYNIPDDRFALYGDTIADNKMLNCFYYSDWAVGQFIRQIKNQPVFDSTIFVFTSDHCAHQSPRYPLSPETFHIPLLMYSPALLGDSAVIVTASAGQVDILPTIIGLTGIGTTHYSWGQNLFDLSPDDSGLAVIVSGEKLGLIEGSQFYFHWVGISESLYDLNERPYLENNLIGSHRDRAERMRKYLNSYIQLADYLSRGDLKITESLKKE